MIQTDYFFVIFRFMRIDSGFRSFPIHLHDIPVPDNHQDKLIRKEFWHLIEFSDCFKAESIENGIPKI